MKLILLRLTSLAASLLLISCDTLGSSKKNTHENHKGNSLDTSPDQSRYLQQPTRPDRRDTSDDTPTPPEKTKADEPAKPQTPDPPKEDTPPPAPSTPAAPAQLPYGKPVPGKNGFVTSPYDGSAGMIDVRDISPGTKVRDPYTGKIFLVP